MGTQITMGRSISTSANFICKLHIAALQAQQPNIRVYPVMDGFYVSTPNQVHILGFLRAVFEAVAAEFNAAQQPQHRFIIRGALAFGPVVHGCDIPRAASLDLDNNAHYRDQILLGLPMVQAHLAEAKAPPFGVHVHESARAFSPAGAPPLAYIWWPWRNHANAAVWTALSTALAQHFDWCAQRALSLDYPLERIKAHKEMAAQYFI